MSDVFYPIEIPDTPLPQQPAIGVVGNGVQSGDVLTPSTIQDTGVPTKRVAQELVSASLNTHSRKILQDYSFTQSGSIQIGTYVIDESGDIRLTPNGITARNKDGLTTFALDGDSGDAAFAGAVRAGAVIGGNGNVVIEEAADGGGRIVIYTNGVPSIVIGDPA